MRNSSGLASFSALFLVLFIVAPSLHAQRLIPLDPCTPVRSMKDAKPAGKGLFMVLPRNGTASAMAALTPSAVPVAAVCRGLSMGDSVLTNIVIRYGVAGDDFQPDFEIIRPEKGVDVTEPYVDVLLPEKPETADRWAIVVTVTAGKDAVPGTYKGALTVAGESIPLTAKISNWICPPPSEWVTHTGLLVSPETLSRHYGVKIWSEEHWRLVGEECRYMAELGADDLILTLYPRNFLGQEKPWITFKSGDGGPRADLTVANRYMTMARSAGVDPHAIIVDAWHSGRYEAEELEVIVDGVPAKVSRPGSGKDAFWMQLFEDIRLSVKNVGWGQERILVGTADDRRPSEKVIKAFAEIAPYAKWAVWTHGRSDPPPWKGRWIIDKMDVGHYEHLFCPALGALPESGISGGWNLDVPEYASLRNYVPHYAPPSQYRAMAEGSMVDLGRGSGKMTRSGSGFARIPLDFWPVSIGSRFRRVSRSLLLYYERKPWEIFLRNNTRSLLAPGPKGPVATIRYEMLREGLQESEARVVIEKALTSGKLAKELATECRGLLRERWAVREKNGRFKGGHAGNIMGAEDRLWGVASDRVAETLKLFDLAARVKEAQAKAR